MTRRVLPRVECPVCHLMVPVYRTSERVYVHNNYLTDVRCGGAGQRVDLYGSARW